MERRYLIHGGSHTETMLFDPAHLSTQSIGRTMARVAANRLLVHDESIIGSDMGSSDMSINEFAHLNPAQLVERLRQLTRSEQDMEERLMARDRQAHESGEDEPVRKRLFFLLAALRRQRRATEKALETCEDVDRVAAFFCGIKATVASIFTAAHAHQPNAVSREHSNGGNETVNLWPHPLFDCLKRLRRRLAIESRQVRLHKQVAM